MENKEILEKIAKLEIDAKEVDLNFLNEDFIESLLKEDYMNIRLRREPESNRLLTKLVRTNERFNIIWSVWDCGNYLKKVPEEVKDLDLCKLAIRCHNDNENAFKYTPDKYKDEEFCLLALANGFKFEEVAPKNPTKEFCLQALEYDYQTLLYMPKEYIDYETYKTAVASSMYAMRNIPMEFVTDELCDLATDKHGYGLSLIPMEFRTLERCKKALKKDGRVIEFVPKHLMSQINIEKLIASCGSAIEHIEPQYLTYEACKIAASINPNFFKYIPEKYRDEEMYLSLSKGLGNYHPSFNYNHIKFFEMLPMNLKTEEFYMKCVKENGEIIAYRPHYINESIVTKELCVDAVKSCGSALRFVPLEFIDYELLKLAVTTKVKKDYKNPVAVLVELYNNNKTKLKDFVNKELFEIAIKKSPASLKYVPEEFKTYEICSIAIRRSRTSIKYVPNHILEKINNNL